MPTESWAALMAKAEVPTGGGGKLLAAGVYRAAAKSIKVSNPKGKDKLSVLWEVLEGPEKGEKIWDNLTVSPDSPVALGIFFQTFERMGGSLDTLRMGGNLEAASSGIPGQIRDLTLKVEEWPKGQTPPSQVNRVSRYNKVTEESVKPPVVPHAPVLGTPQDEEPF
jgi:hypothetical protein